MIFLCLIKGFIIEDLLRYDFIIKEFTRFCLFSKTYKQNFQAENNFIEIEILVCLICLFFKSFLVDSLKVDMDLLGVEARTLIVFPNSTKISIFHNQTLVSPSTNSN